MVLQIIDLASYQAGINVAKTGAAGAIVKLTEGTTYLDPASTNQVNQTKAAGMLLGLYHFLSAGNATAQAQYFLSKVGNNLGTAVLALDFESYKENGVIKHASVSDAESFLNYVHSKTGVWPLFYCGLSEENNYNLSNIAKNCGLWIAQYNTMNKLNGFSNPSLYGTVKHWKTVALHQYSSNVKTAGFSSGIDASVFYGDKTAWAKYAKASSKPTVATTPVAKPTASATQSLENLANQVIAGKLGNGNTRKQKLGKLYAGVQKVVDNKLKATTQASTVAVLKSETLKGNFGNGDTRKKILGGYYELVQAAINGETKTVRSYSVKYGDTLSGIGAKLGVSWQSIAAINGIKSPYTIYPGQSLKY
jgi:GH25 family lysozyme M1 (1,4-beta-N-acetylmuramidase)